MCAHGFIPGPADAKIIQIQSFPLPSSSPGLSARVYFSSLTLNFFRAFLLFFHTSTRIFTRVCVCVCIHSEYAGREVELVSLPSSPSICFHDNRETVSAATRARARASANGDRSFFFVLCFLSTKQCRNFHDDSPAARCAGMQLNIVDASFLAANNIHVDRVTSGPCFLFPPTPARCMRNPRFLSACRPLVILFFNETTDHPAVCSPAAPSPRIARSPLFRAVKLSCVSESRMSNYGNLSRQEKKQKNERWPYLSAYTKYDRARKKKGKEVEGRNEGILRG